jgi:hypothetical protein
MHLQIRSTVTKSSSGPGAQSADEAPDGVTIVRPGRLLRLLELLAEDRTERDGHGPFNLVAAAGSGIETTGEFIFAVASDDENDEAEHEAALRRIKAEFPRSEITERIHGDLPHHAGSLLDFVRGIVADGLLIDEIVVGVARCADGGSGGDKTGVPVQVHALRPS